jgi:hypothetical protein
MKLSIGDTFKNSVGKQITVKNIYNLGRRCELSCPQWESTYHHNVEDIVDRIQSGHYRNYVAATRTRSFKVGDLVVVTNAITGNSSCIGHVGRITRMDNSSAPFEVDGSWCNDVEHVTQSTLSTMKQWKKEDFFNTKIIVDTPEKSRRFQELMLSLGIMWGGIRKEIQHTEVKFLYISEHILCYGSYGSREFSKNKKREIFYNDIFNNSNNQSINNNQNGNKESNDILGENLSGCGREEKATACKYIRKSTTSSSSGYTGNQIKGRTAPIRVGRSEISFQAVAA